MAKVRVEDSTFEVPPAGTHPAVCVAVIDLGTHDREREDKKKGTKVWVPTTEVYLAFEIARRKKDGGAFLVGKAYTLSLNEKANLFKITKALLGSIPPEVNVQEDFPGKSCLVVVGHKTKEGEGGSKRTFANLESISPPMDGQAAFPFLTYFTTWEMGQPLNQDDFSHLPRIYGEKIEDVIARSKEMTAAQEPGGRELQSISSGDVGRLPF